MTELWQKVTLQCSVCCQNSNSCAEIQKLGTSAAELLCCLVCMGQPLRSLAAAADRRQHRVSCEQHMIVPSPAPHPPREQEV